MAVTFIGFMKEEIISFEVKNIRKKKTFSIELTSNESLLDLHEAILQASKLSWEHSFSFFMSDKFWDDENEYAGGPFNAGRTKIKLKKLNLKSGDTFLYLYDYGSEIRFKISVVNIA
jgi:hypothetical protein